MLLNSKKFIFILCFMPSLVYGMEKEKTTTNTTAPAKQRNLLFCDNCCKEETIKKFALCSRCRAVRYCCQACQTEDWKNHKTECLSGIDRAQKNEKIKAIREQLKFRVSDYVTQPGATLVTEADMQAIEAGLEKYGQLYRDFLVEEMMGAVHRNDHETLKTHAPLVIAATKIPSLSATFPIFDPLLGDFQNMVRNMVDFAHRFGVPKDHAEKRGALYKIFEEGRAEGTLFLSHNYASEANKALQVLRRKLMQKILNSLDRRKVRPAIATCIQDILFIWAYKMLCTIPCLRADKTAEFVRSIAQEDPLLLFSCLNHATILLHSLKNDPSFGPQLKNFGTMGIEDINILALIEAVGIERFLTIILTKGTPPQLILDNQWLPDIVDFLTPVIKPQKHDYLEFIVYNPWYMTLELAKVYVANALSKK